MAKSAQRRVFDLLAKLDQSLDIAFLPFAFTNTIEYFEHPLRTDTAGHALTTGLLLHEFKKEPCDIDHTGVFIHDDHAAGTHDRAKFGKRFIVERDVQVLFGHTSARWASDLGGLERLVIHRAATDIVHQLTQCCAYRHFDQSGIFDRSGQCKYFCTLALLGAE